MGAAPVFPTPSRLRALYALPDSVWVELNFRVRLFAEAERDGELESLVRDLLQYTPNAAEVAKACQLWNASTFPSLLARSTEASLFGAQAVRLLEGLVRARADARPGAPVPDSVRFLYSVELRALARSAASLRDQCEPLRAPIADFLRQSRVADANVISKVGPWPAVEKSFAAFEQAIALMLDGWGLLCDDLLALSDGTIVVTTEALLAADLQADIDEWKSLSEDARGFGAAVARAA